jgi:1,2-dihydroxy-3-keto-5-methylthiopentene dioxygenase
MDLRGVHMSRLRISPTEDPERHLLDIEDGGEIAARLASHGVEFSRWSPASPLAPGRRSPSEVLAAFAPEVSRLARRGYATVDVVSVEPDADDPAWSERARSMRERFRDEHTHADDEIRFFAAGRGLFYLRLESERVHLVWCEAGDLLSVPAGTRHWFDMGRDPSFTAIRFFTNPDGWVGHFTGDPIARRFPGLDHALHGAGGRA